MFFYQPPKSSIWGHSLRKMPAIKARELFAKFLEIAVASYVSSAWTTQRNYKDLDLTQEQFEFCWQEIIAEQTGGNMGKESLAQVFIISAWRIHGKTTPTSSRITMFYGGSPCISMQLQFDRMEDFEYIKRTLEELGLCKLNEKHLKSRRLGRK